MDLNEIVWVANNSKDGNRPWNSARITSKEQVDASTCSYGAMDSTGAQVSFK